MNVKVCLLALILTCIPATVIGKIVQQINPNGTITYTNVYEAPPKVEEPDDPDIGDVIDDIKIYSVSTKVIKRGRNYVYVALKVKVKNLSDEQDIQVLVACIDRDGFQLDETYVSGIVRPGRIGYLTDQTMIEKAIFPKIDKWQAK